MIPAHARTKIHLIHCLAGVAPLSRLGLGEVNDGLGKLIKDATNDAYAQEDVKYGEESRCVSCRVNVSVADAGRGLGLQVGVWVGLELASG